MDEEVIILDEKVKKKKSLRPKKMLTLEERMELERERKRFNSARVRYKRSLATPEEAAKRRARDAAYKRASRQRNNGNKSDATEMNINSGKYRAIRPKIEIQDPTEFVSCEIYDVENRVEPTEFIVCDSAAILE